MERAKLSQKPNNALFTIYELNAFAVCEYTRGWVRIVGDIRSAEQDDTFSDLMSFFHDNREGYMLMPQTSIDLRNIIIKLFASTYRQSTEVLKLSFADFATIQVSLLQTRWHRLL